jgi:hypothetical protein
LGERYGDHRRGQAAARGDPTRHVGDAALAAVTISHPRLLGVVHGVSFRRVSWETVEDLDESPVKHLGGFFERRQM